MWQLVNLRTDFIYLFHIRFFASRQHCRRDYVPTTSGTGSPGVSRRRWQFLRNRLVKMVHNRIMKDESLAYQILYSAVKIIQQKTGATRFD